MLWVEQVPLAPHVFAWVPVPVSAPRSGVGSSRAVPDVPAPSAAATWAAELRRCRVLCGQGTAAAPLQISPSVS